MAATQELLIGEGAGGAAKVYIEDVFSTYLYTGNGTSQTITNNIDLSTKGGLVWLKDRGDGTSYHALYDTARTLSYRLSTNTTNAQSFVPGVDAYYSNGFNLGSTYNANGNNFVSWTFRKQPKFFDVVTYTGTGVARTVAHNLGSVPGCIIVKRTSASGQDWAVYHRSIGNTKRMNLNLTDTGNVSAFCWNNTDPTSTDFTVGTILDVNGNGSTYVAYLFAHDAGGFGLTGTDNVISCGSFTTDASGNATVSLGYEPQWILRKRVDAADDWYLLDNMRGMVVDNGAGTGDKYLYPNASYAEFGAYGVDPTSTGFKTTGIGTSSTHIYIAIRRGPMKVPTDATKVFNATTRTGTGANATVTAGSLPYVDMAMISGRPSAAYKTTYDRLRGATKYIYTPASAAETTDTASLTSFALMNGVTVGTDSGGVGVNTNGLTLVNWLFQRAPGFFDVVCYTGDSTAGRAVTHNLGVAPELIIVKDRAANTAGWRIYAAPLGNTQHLYLERTDGTTTSTTWNNTSPTASVFYLGGGTAVNGSTLNYVAYLFATCPGVSKVGSYTGTGTTKQVDCGFAAGARFVLIKRTDSTGDWYVWDTARGIVSGNDPYLLLNSTAAETTTTDYIDTYSAGFELSSTAPAALNASGGTYIFLAIA